MGLPTPHISHCRSVLLDGVNARVNKQSILGFTSHVEGEWPQKKRKKEEVAREPRPTIDQPQTSIRAGDIGLSWLIMPFEQCWLEISASLDS